MLDANQRYVDLIANIQGGVITCLFDVKTLTSRTLYINNGWTELTQYTLEELNFELGGNPQALVFEEDRESANKDYEIQTLKGNSYQLQYRVVRKDQSVIWVIDRGIVTFDALGNIENQSIITEVTEIKEKEEHFWKLSQTDALTGLYNKMASATLIQNIIDVKKMSIHALMVIDIDNFKWINDNLGHILGDTVLIEVSARLKQLFRVEDIVGRTGGDEFIIFMVDIISKEAATLKANEVCDTFRNIYMKESENHKISCSIGICVSIDGSDYQDLFNKADIALYRAKKMGKDQCFIYNKHEAIDSVYS